ncbi:sirohydrochlorin chelatase [Shimia marina]|uniref:Cobalamin biosynthesis protein CbiX n=1 Tax=Shimia marina TaxID=321267 RepID=A0A0P1EU80_9RHOB|nr:CbiX/SirB N-terminal domain-containing protein [Shimia marina]CUH54141.1 hypothetical protein SHM7688_03611 [Shimia marina]SFD96523.1 Sirohydrochlorin ferrochelatase [Shimia marina]
MSREALIVAHGQPSAPVPPELWLMGFAEAVRKHLPDWTIRAATLAMPEALEREAAALPPNAPVFPMFMADGWFVGKVLPRRLNGAEVTILPPLGFDPNLPGFAAQLVRDALTARGWALSESRLLLAAHGSAKGPKAAESANAFKAALAAQLPDLPISVGFVEEAPFVEEAARDLPPQTLCLPFFALEGDHCREDIPEALNKAAFAGDLLPPLGTWPQVAQMVAQSLKDTA